MTPEQFEFMALTTSYTEALWRCVPAREVALVAMQYVIGTGDTGTVQHHLPQLLRTPATREALIKRVELLHRKNPNAFTFPPPIALYYPVKMHACYALTVVNAANRCCVMPPIKQLIEADISAAMRAYPDTYDYAATCYYLDTDQHQHSLDLLLRWAFSDDELSETVHDS